MQPPHIKSTPRLALLTLGLILVSSQAVESIVKQQQQQQQSQQAQQSQQQRSDDLPLQAQQANSNNQNAFNNHQQPAAGATGSQQQQQQQVASQLSANSRTSAVSSAAATGPLDAMSSYASAAPSAGQKQQPAGSYLDSMAAAASNPEQSYQAAAQSVNMALANSGIFGPSAYAAAMPQQQQQQQQQQQTASSAAAGNQQQTGQSGNLNPLHYFYYPAKEAGQGQGASIAAASPNKQQDMMANAATNQYQSMAGYPAYADQYSSYGPAASSPEAAASSQDASYLPQPMDGQQQSHQPVGPQMYGSQQQQQQQGQNPQQQQQSSQSMGNQQPQQQYGNSDLSAYSSSQMPASSISFNGPSAGSAQQQSNSMQPQMGAGQSDYLSPNLNGHQSQQQQAGQSGQSGSGGYQNNLFSQLASGGDLSTSNFGNNAGGLASIASYMPPNGQTSNPQQQQQHHQAAPQNDIFASGLLGGQFNSAASQLTPASIAPPNQPQQQQAGVSVSSLYSGASSLFNSANQPQSPQQQQQNNLFGSVNGANNYLSSLLTPQQYQQLAGQQLTAMASEQSPLSMSALNSLQQQQQQQQQSPATAASQVASASGSSKRFGLGSFIMPMLALAGLSLLIPTMNNFVPVMGRKKRSIVEERASSSNRQQQMEHEPQMSVSKKAQILKENSIGEYMERIERYYSIYRNAVENDDCLNRLICEFGDAVKDVTGKSAVTGLLETMVPNWMTGKMHLFKEAALATGTNGKEKCKKYICHSGRQQK